MWLKKQQPTTLYQASDLPYVILEDGVRLCYDNFYFDCNQEGDHKISFSISPTSLKRINTYCYKINSFPATVEFPDVVFLNDAIIRGKTIKHATLKRDETQSVIIVKSEHITRNSDSDLSEINELLDEHDHSFMLVGETIDPVVRLFEGVSTILHHQNWPRTLVSIANQISDSPDRKYCWTRSLPDLSLSCYGLDYDEISTINESLAHIGIDDISVQWVE